MLLGRLDGKTSNITGANTEIPGPMDSLQVLKQRFNAVGLDDTDLVVLSGNQTHTILIAKFYSKMAGAESNDQVLTLSAGRNACNLRTGCTTSPGQTGRTRP